MSRSRWALLGVGALFIVFVSHVLVAQKIIIRNPADPDNPLVLTISALTPSSGAVGATVTITGTGFGASQGSGSVTFNGTTASPSVWAATSITVTVPSGATTGNVLVRQGTGISNNLAFTVTGGGGGTTYNAANCTLATVQGLHDSTIAASGDTIQLPTCDVTWTGTLTTTKAFTLLGNGNTNTVIHRDHAGNFMTITVPADAVADGPTVRVSAIKIILESGGGSIFDVTGSYTDERRIRIDNLVTECSGASSGIFIYSWQNFGVIDHNDTTTCTDAQAQFSQVIGRTTGYGDESWAANYAFGSKYFLTFEDNTFTSTSTNPLTMVDCHGGGRYRFRYNTVVNGLLDGHGPETGRVRGCNAIEAYYNTFVSLSGVGNFFYIRCCSGVLHHNAVYDIFGVVANLLYFGASMTMTHAEGGSDGRTVWGVNDAGNPFATCSSASAVGSYTVTCAGLNWTTDQWQGYTVRRTYTNGTSTKRVASAAGGAGGMTRSGTTITVHTETAHGLTTGDAVSIVNANESGYNGTYASGTGSTVTVVDSDTFTVSTHAEATPASPATGSDIFISKGGYFSEISSNTNTEQLTFKSPLFSGARDLVFVTGDSFEINLVTHGMDQPGRAGGSLVSGTVVTVPGGWNDQTTAGWYEWNNCLDTQNPPRIDCGGGGTDIDFASALNSRLIRPGVHYFNDTSKPSYTDYTYPDPLIE